jgi:hypothetical protein
MASMIGQLSRKTNYLLLIFIPVLYYITECCYYLYNTTSRIRCILGNAVYDILRERLRIIQLFVPRTLAARLDYNDS